MSTDNPATQVERVAKTVCAYTNWSSVTNLHLLKMLYIMQMLWMGENKGQPLFDADFYAWHYGPVTPDVYYKCRLFGAEVIYFDPWGRRLPELSGDVEGEIESRAYESVKRWTQTMQDLPVRDLVGITHWTGGAWAKHYTPTAKNFIPREDVLQECKDRGWYDE